MSWWCLIASNRVNLYIYIYILIRKRHQTKKTTHSTCAPKNMFYQNGDSIFSSFHLYGGNNTTSYFQHRCKPDFNSCSCLHDLTCSLEGWLAVTCSDSLVWISPADSVQKEWNWRSNFRSPSYTRIEHQQGKTFFWPSANLTLNICSVSWFLHFHQLYRTAHVTEKQVHGTEQVYLPTAANRLVQTGLPLKVDWACFNEENQGQSWSQPLPDHQEMSGIWTYPELHSQRSVHQR